MSTRPAQRHAIIFGIVTADIRSRDDSPSRSARRSPFRAMTLAPQENPSHTIEGRSRLHRSTFRALIAGFNDSVGHVLLSEEYMRKRKSQSRVPWQRRREEYLRASGRHIDLIKEGYARGESPTDWIVLVGHRKSDYQGSHPRSRLFLVSGETATRTSA